MCVQKSYIPLSEMGSHEGNGEGGIAQGDPGSHPARNAPSRFSPHSPAAGAWLPAVPLQS